LRLVCAVELGRLRGSIERERVRHPVLVPSAVEADCWVLVDGFKRLIHGQVSVLLEERLHLRQIVDVERKHSKRLPVDHLDHLEQHELRSEGKVEQVHRLRDRHPRRKGLGQNNFAIRGVEARGWQGARRANSRSIQPTSNAASRDGSAFRVVELF